MILLRLLGGLALSTGGEPVVGRAAQRHRLALLALLGASRSEPVSRDKLADILWPETGQRARRLLSNSVHLIRKALGEDSIIGTADALRLNPERVHCDVRDLDAAIARGDLTGAVKLYRGPFLDGFYLASTPGFEAWVEQERGRLARAYVQALETLATRCESVGEYRSAATWWRELLEQDPLAARTTLRRMRALEAAGDVEEAVQCARAYESQVHTELGLEPDRTVMLFAERLVRERGSDGEPMDRLPPRLVSGTAGMAPGAATAAVYAAAGSDQGPGGVTVFRLRTLGGAALERDGVPLDTVGAQRKTLALLTLLAVSRGQGIGRERLAAYLWPESNTERARGALKQALHVARRQLGSGEAIVGTGELRLNRSYVESDVDAFLSALEEGELERAASLYRGPFLDGFHLSGNPEFEQWASAQRTELALQYASALERLATGAEAQGDPESAIPWLRRLQATDPFSARTILRLMHAFDAAGDRVAAQRCAQVHASLLREELDSPPDPEVSALAARLREEPIEPPRAALPPQPVSPSPGADTPGALAPGVSKPIRAEAPRQAIRRSYMAAAFVALAAVAAIALFVTSQRQPGAGDAQGRPGGPSVAVLPFANVSGDSADEYLSEGIANELVTALSRVQGLRVAPLTAASALTRKGSGVRAIADTLGVATVLDGTVRRDGDRLEVTARLVDVRGDRVLWSETYEREVRDVFTIQTELVRATVGALHGGQPPADGSRFVARPTSDPEAYELYLQARYSWMLPVRERLERAAVYYQRAIARDPAFAMAYAGLAETYTNLSNFGILGSREAFARADVAADRALALDPQLAEAHAAKALVLASTQEFRAAEAAFRRAIDLSPSYAWARHYYSLLLLILGRTNEALEQNRQALAADANSLPANATRGIILLQRGDYLAADRELERALTLAPDFPLTQYYLGVVRAAQGRYRDAGLLLEQAAKGAPGAPGFTGVPGGRALVLQRTGRQQAADSLLTDLEAQAEAGDERARANLAFAHAALGQVDAAFALFDQVQWDVPSLIELRADPLLEPLRSDPRYPALLKRIGAGR
jgi:adenylate cyclase